MQSNISNSIHFPDTLRVFFVGGLFFFYRMVKHMGGVEKRKCRAGLAPALSNILFQRATAKVAPTKIE
jgi:hypothetical protein